MTRKEFERLRMEIEGEEFRDDIADPIAYGIQRAAFEQRKFKKLIAVARKVDLQTVRAKLERWERQLARLRQTQERFEQLRDARETLAARSPPAKNRPSASA